MRSVLHIQYEHGHKSACKPGKKATEVLGSDFDIEIVEKHHNQKIDAPSGTALMLADAICEEIDEPVKYEYDRHSKREKRTKTRLVCIP